MAYIAALPPFTRDLNSMVRAEYLEMPGLCLTVAQAARLWNVSRDECLQTLDALTQGGLPVPLEGPISESGQRSVVQLTNVSAGRRGRQLA